jgi:hypothetical protein
VRTVGLSLHSFCDLREVVQSLLLAPALGRARQENAAGTKSVMSKVAQKLMFRDFGCCPLCTFSSRSTGVALCFNVDRPFQRRYSSRNHSADVLVCEHSMISSYEDNTSVYTGTAVVY